ncbi:ankyrin repeat-containing domain protein [Trichoderma afarasin]
MPDIVFVSGITSRSQSEDARSGLRRFVADRFPGHLPHFFDLLGAEDTHMTNDQVISLKARELLTFLLGIRSSQSQNVPANETSSATGMSDGQKKQEPMVLLGHDIGGLLIKAALLDAQHHYEYLTLAKNLLIVFFNTPHRIHSKSIWEEFQLQVIRPGDWNEQKSRMMQCFYIASERLENEFATVFFKTPIFSVHEGAIVDWSIMVTGLAKETQFSFPLESTGPRTFQQIVIYPDSSVWRLVDSWLEELSYVTVEVHPNENFLNQLCKDGVPSLLSLASRYPSHGLFRAYLENSSDFQNWANSDECAHLFLHGPPGYGSTESAVEILTYISRTSKENSPVVLNFFFDGKDARCSTNDSLVRSLLIQLLISSSIAKRVIQEELDLDDNASSLGTQFLWNILAVLLSHSNMGPIVCVIAEENGGAEWTYSLSHMKKVIKSCESSRSACKFFIAASSDSIIALGEQAVNISLDNEAIQKGVRDFYAGQIGEILKTRPIFEQALLSPNTADSVGVHISDVLVKVSALGSLKTGHTKKKARYWFESLKLPHLEFLDILMDSLTPQSLSILRWMAVASRPLSVTEMSVAISLSDDDQSLADIEDCQSWSIYTEIQENLDQLVCIVNQEIAQRLLKYLTLMTDHPQDLSANEIRDNKLSATPNALSLVGYAALYWPTHYRASSRSDSLIQLVDSVLNNERLYRVLADIIQPIFKKPVPDDLKMKQGVVLASYLGIAEVVERHILRDHDMHTDNDILRTTLVSAAREGHQNVVKLFLDQGITSNEAILACCEEGHCDILRDILSRINTNEEIMDTLDASLLQASKRGHLSVVQELLDRNISPNKTDSITGCNTVHMAAQFGHSDIVDLLIRSESNNSATLNAYNQDNYNPLQLAAAGGYLHIVHALISAGRISPTDFYQQKNPPPICIATKYGHIDVVKALINSDFNIYLPMDSGRTVLHVAAERGWEKLVAWFLDYIGQPEQGHKTNDSTDDDKENKSIRSNCDEGKVAERTQLLLTAKDYDGYTALHLAAKFGHLDVVRLITDAGNASAVVDATGPEAYRPLHFASESGYHDIVRHFIETEVSIENVTEESNTALHLAAREGRKHVVSALLQYIRRATNASELLWMENSSQLTALSLAAQRGNLHIVWDIVSTVEDWLPNTPAWQKDPNALFKAVREGHDSVVKYLLESGWQPNQVNRDGATPLQVAIESNDHSKVVTALIEGGASTELLAGGLNETPLYLAVEKDRIQSVQAILAMGKNELNFLCGDLKWSALHEANNKPDFLKLLLESHADPNVVNGYGSTPLFLASEMGNLESVQLLLDYGAKPDISNMDGATALHRAVKNKHLEIVKILVQKGVDVNHAREDGSTPLYWACYSEEIAEYLLKHGADPNKTGGSHHSCIQFAAWMGYSNIIKLLIDNMADVNAIGGRNGSPLNAAVADRNIPNVKLLLENGADPNKPDHQGLSAFHRISDFFKRESQDIIGDYLDLFQNHKGLIDVKTSEGLTPLVYAARDVNPGAVKALLIRGADLFEVDGRQRSCLHWAACNGDLDCLCIILDWLDNCEAEKKIDMISNAIHGAIIRYEYGAFEKLLSKDIVNKANCNGWTPLATAIEYQQVYMEKALRSIGALETTEPQLEPTEWNKYDKQARLGVQQLECFVEEPLSAEDMQMDFPLPPSSIVRANRCAPQTGGGVYYFEVLVVQTGLYEAVGVGFATDETELENQLGWTMGSWGFHGENGKVYHARCRRGRPYAEPYSSGSTIGCGVDFNNRSIFFTVDGEYKGCAFKDDLIRGHLYPAVFLHPGNPSAKIVANFGHQEFKYTIPLAPGPWESESPDNMDFDEEDPGYESSVLSDDSFS